MRRPYARPTDPPLSPAEENRRRAIRLQRQAAHLLRAAGATRAVIAQQAATATALGFGRQEERARNG